MILYSDTRPPADQDQSRIKLGAVYSILTKHYGDQSWWPASSRWEVIVGAILTQNTSWKNVTRAIGQLKQNQALHRAAMSLLSLNDLAQLIRSSGYFNQKAKKLKLFIEALERDFGGTLKKCDQQTTASLRIWLLSIWGIGPETADSILLYAFKRPVFVVDSYTERLLYCLGYSEERATYAKMIEGKQAKEMKCL